MALDPTQLLCVMDCDYLYGGARANYSHAHRVDYTKVIQLIKKDRPNDLTYHFHAFIAMKDNPVGMGQFQFLSRLMQWGFDVHTGVLAYDPTTGEKQRDDVTGMILEFLKNFTCDQFGNTYPKTVAVVSGSLAFAGLYEALLYQGVVVEVYSYKPWERQDLFTSRELAPISHHTLLTDAILYIPPL